MFLRIPLSYLSARVFVAGNSIAKLVVTKSVVVYLLKEASAKLTMGEDHGRLCTCDKCRDSVRSAGHT